MLRQWYKLMIKRAVKDGIVVDQTNLFNEFFVPSNIKISAARNDLNALKEATFNAPNMGPNNQERHLIEACSSVGHVLNEISPLAKPHRRSHEEEAKNHFLFRDMSGSGGRKESLACCRLALLSREKTHQKGRIQERELPLSCIRIQAENRMPIPRSDGSNLFICLVRICELNCL
ncbi:hypothetical protein L1987_15390 [Smallanthus sonchifolius]|uniref:Uncharacterized protein n=1 Tax=Smallanthus sonchifolius TaxID=185202 RepID=A0ACB9J7L0_9ASTR|nr:hypothetical protein L1987_15390 [Smallanthus sonchifolius]